MSVASPARLGRHRILASLPSTGAGESEGRCRWPSGLNANQCLASHIQGSPSSNCRSRLHSTDLRSLAISVTDTTLEYSATAIGSLTQLSGYVMVTGESNRLITRSRTCSAVLMLPASSSGSSAAAASVNAHNKPIVTTTVTLLLCPLLRWDGRTTDSYCVIQAGSAAAFRPLKTPACDCRPALRCPWKLTAVT